MGNKLEFVLSAVLGQRGQVQIREEKPQESELQLKEKNLIPESCKDRTGYSYDHHLPLVSSTQSL
jgi:hypothetical protein